MELYLTDLSSTRSTYDYGGITAISDEGYAYDPDNLLSSYKSLILPWKEKGTKTTVFEVSETCDRIGANLYFLGETKEWQASL